MPKQFPFELTYPEALGAPKDVRVSYFQTVTKAFRAWAQSQGLQKQCRGEYLDTVMGFGISTHNHCCVDLYNYKLGYAETIELWLTTVATVEQLGTFIEAYKYAIAKCDRELKWIKNFDHRGRVATRKMELKRVRNEVMKIRRERLKTA